MARPRDRNQLGQARILPYFNSATIRDADVYHLDFKHKTGHFTYKRKLSRLEIWFYRYCTYFPWWFYWGLVAEFLFFPFFYDLLAYIDGIGLVVSPYPELTIVLMILFSFMLWIASLRSFLIVDHHAKSKKLKPTLVIPACKLGKTWSMRVDWQAVRFWYSKDVEKQISKATITNVSGIGWRAWLLDSTKWELKVFFARKPRSGALGLRFT